MNLISWQAGKQAPIHREHRNDPALPSLPVKPGVSKKTCLLSAIAPFGL
jgi:hypothetical protein